MSDEKVRSQLDYLRDAVADVVCYTLTGNDDVDDAQLIDRLHSVQGVATSLVARHIEARRQRLRAATLAERTRGGIEGRLEELTLLAAALGLGVEYRRSIVKDQRLPSSPASSVDLPLRELLDRLADARDFIHSYAGDYACNEEQADHMDRDAERHRKSIDQAMHALSSVCPPTGEWQDIETAPKDGRAVIGFDPTRESEWMDGIEFMRWVDGYWLDPATHRMRATRWMPLPAPPVTGEDRS